jgi:hypothetical protein
VADDALSHEEQEQLHRLKSSSALMAGRGFVSHQRLIPHAVHTAVRGGALPDEYSEDKAATHLNLVARKT